MKRFFACFFLASMVGCLNQAIAQKSAFMLIEGVVFAGRTPLKSVNINVFLNNAKTDQIKSVEDGTFTIMLKYNQKYTVEISKYGFVTKKLIFNTELPEGVRRDQVNNFPLQVELFPPFEEIDMSLLEQPLALIEYDEETGMFGFDVKEATETMKKVQALQAEIQKKLDELAKLYKKEFENAEVAYKQRNYKLAKDDYEKCLQVYPEKTADLYIDVEYLRKRIDYIEKLLSDRLAKDREKKAQKEYKDAMAKAESAYAKKLYDEALDLYSKAAVILPNESGPKSMIDKINKTMSDNIFLSLQTSAVFLKDKMEKKYTFAPVKSYQRRNNYIMLKVRNTSGHDDCKLYVKFGSGNETGGGFVIKDMKTDEAGNSLIRLSSQDKWLRMDANWISLYPEGGDVEVEMLQVTRVE